MSNSNQQILNLYHTQFQNTSKQANVTKRRELLSVNDDNIFYPMKPMAHEIETEILE
jgi:hypothetical protein